MNKNKYPALKLGLLIFVISVILNIIETAYFGWNTSPQGIVEMYCDGICALGLIFGLLMAVGWAFGWGLASGAEDKLNSVEGEK